MKRASPASLELVVRLACVLRDVYGGTAVIQEPNPDIDDRWWTIDLHRDSQILRFNPCVIASFDKSKREIWKSGSLASVHPTDTLVEQITVPLGTNG